jgi:hypothetical protein
MLKDTLSISEFFDMRMDRWIWDNRFMLIINFVSLFVSIALGFNPLALVGKLISLLPQ